MTSVLVIDGDQRIVMAVRAALVSRGYRVITAARGAAALRVAAEVKPGLVVLEPELPDVDGVELIGSLRGWSKAPIIVISHRSGVADKVRALDAGADDYVTKPFEMDELLARLRVAQRRVGAACFEGQPDVLVDAGTFTVDLKARKVWRDGATVHLTRTEWGVLTMLVRHQGSLVTHAQLLDAVWGPGHTTNAHYLRVYLGHLRRKLEPQRSRPRHLITEPGMGYRFLIESATGQAS